MVAVLEVHMPCDSSHMEASEMEKEVSRIRCIMDELDGKPLNKDYFDGYHPSAYNKLNTRATADSLTKALCERMSKLPSVANLSLEAQMWWRDHQIADEKRKLKEKEEIKRCEEIANALNKLTDYEVGLLGIPDVIRRVNKALGMNWRMPWN